MNDTGYEDAADGGSRPYGEAAPERVGDGDTAPVTKSARERLDERMRAQREGVKDWERASERHARLVRERAEVIARHDAEIASAEAVLDEAVATLVELMGVASAADILVISAKRARRAVNEVGARRGSAGGREASAS